METVTRNQIEQGICQLSLDDQLWLMERLAQHIRKNATHREPESVEAQLVEMANDPDIQRELRAIDKEAENVYIQR